MRQLLPLLLFVGCATKPVATTSISFPPLPPAPRYSLSAPTHKTVAWDVTGELTTISHYQLVAFQGNTSTNWNVGLATRFSPPLPPGTWSLYVIAVSTNSATSEPSNVVTLTVPAPDTNRVWKIAIEGTTHLSLSWSDWRAFFETNPPNHFFRLKAERIQ